MLTVHWRYYEAEVELLGLPVLRSLSLRSCVISHGELGKQISQSAFVFTRNRLCGSVGSSARHGGDTLRGF